MSQKPISPVAERIIAKCGGHTRVSELAQVSVNYVYRWTYPQERGGLSGRVPETARRRLLELARTGQVPLTPFDFEEGWPQADRLGAAFGARVPPSHRE